MTARGASLTCVMLEIVLLLAFVLASPLLASEQPCAEQGCDIGGLLDTLQETWVNLFNPADSDMARDLNNALRIAFFSKLIKRGETVDAYVVTDDHDFITGIYPFPILFWRDASGRPTQKVELTGTGEWYTKREPTIRPAPPNDSGQMTNWDALVSRMVKAHYGYGTVEQGLIRSVISYIAAKKSVPVDRNFEVNLSDRTYKSTSDEGQLGHLAELGAKLLSATDWCAAYKDIESIAGKTDSCSKTVSISQIATLNTLYSYQLQATGGVPPYTWSLHEGPKWLSVNASGLVTGTPPQSALGSAQNVTVSATDSATPSTTSNLSFSVAVTAPAPPSHAPQNLRVVP